MPVVRTNASGPSTQMDEIVSSTSARYVDPLIKGNYSNLASAEHREMVAEFDPLARLLTHIFAETMMAQLPKFYLTDKVESPEIMEDVRAKLGVGDILNVITEALAKFLIHGWCIVYPYLDENGFPNAEVFSEYEIRPEYIIRDNNNKIIGYNVYFTPRLPLFRGRSNLRPIRKILRADQVIHITRGKYNLGFGESIFSGIWDAITKLREESHANAVRSRIFGLATVPAEWSDTQIRQYIEAMAHADENNVVVQRAHLDINSAFTGLPQMQFQPLGANAAQKSNQGGSPQISSLSSEWARICAGTRHTMGYFLGGGILSASKAAASVDLTEDQLVDIQEFNDFANKFFIPFLKTFEDFFGSIPNTFTVKCWMQWQRDEAIVADMLKEQQQLEMQINKYNPNQQGSRVNITPNRFIPVNSASGNVETLFLADNGPNEVPTLYVKYRNPYNWYQYQGYDRGEMFRAAEEVAAEGGEAVWRVLRGKTADYPNGVPDSLKGMPKRSFRRGGPKPTPFAGRVEDSLGMPYQTSRGPTPEPDTSNENGSERPEIGNGENESQPPNVSDGGENENGGLLSKLSVPKSSAVKTQTGTFKVQSPQIQTEFQSITTKIPTLEDQFKKMRIFFGKPYSGYVPPADDHPLLKRHNSVSGMRRDLHIGYDKAVKMLERPLEPTIRFNLAHVGNAFSSKNPYQYKVNGGYRFEFIPPEEIRKNVGKKVPLGVFHDLNGNVELPDWQIIGEYEIYDADDERDYARIKFFDDWKERLPEIKRRLLNSGWTGVEGFIEWVNDIENLIEKGEYDISTAIETRPRFNYAKRRWEQTDINLYSVSIVPIGNCTKPYCKIQTEE